MSKGMAEEISFNPIWLNYAIGYQQIAHNPNVVTLVVNYLTISTSYLIIIYKHSYNIFLYYKYHYHYV
jgi:hypothetical protein